MADFRQLKVWQKAHEITLDVYRITQTFPKAETYGLVSQMRRAAISIGCNIAEGRGRDGDAEFGRFVQIALGCGRVGISTTCSKRSWLCSRSGMPQFGAASCGSWPNVSLLERHSASSVSSKLIVILDQDVIHV